MVPPAHEESHQNGTASSVTIAVTARVTGATSTIGVSAVKLHNKLIIQSILDLSIIESNDFAMDVDELGREAGEELTGGYGRAGEAGTTAQ